MCTGKHLTAGTPVLKYDLNIIQEFCTGIYAYAFNFFFYKASVYGIYFQ